MDCGMWVKAWFEGLGLTKEVNRLRFEVQSLLIDSGFRVKLRFEAFKVQGSRFKVWGEDSKIGN